MSKQTTSASCASPAPAGSGDNATTRVTLVGEAAEVLDRDLDSGIFAGVLGDLLREQFAEVPPRLLLRVLEQQLSLSNTVRLALLVRNLKEPTIEAALGTSEALRGGRNRPPRHARVRLSKSKMAQLKSLRRNEQDLVVTAAFQAWVLGVDLEALAKSLENVSGARSLLLGRLSRPATAGDDQVLSRVLMAATSLLARRRS